MKKYIPIAFILIFGVMNVTIAHSSNFSAELIKKLDSCTYYVEQTDNKIIQVLGWANGRCNFREITSKSVMDCGFKEDQLAEVIEAMKTDKPTTTPFKAIVDNKWTYFQTGYTGLNVWERYRSTSDVCTIEEDKPGRR